MSTLPPKFESVTEIYQRFKMKIEDALEELQNQAACYCHRKDCLTCLRNSLLRYEIEDLMRRAAFEEDYFVRHEVYARCLNSSTQNIPRDERAIEAFRICIDENKQLKALYDQAQHDRSESQEIIMVMLDSQSKVIEGLKAMLPDELNNMQ
jgi:hypothetical protein